MAASSAARVAGTEMAAAVTPDSERAPAMADVPVVAVGEAEAAEALGAALALARPEPELEEAGETFAAAGEIDGVSDDGVVVGSVGTVDVGVSDAVGEGVADDAEAAGANEVDGLGVSDAVGAGVAELGFEAGGDTFSEAAEPVGDDVCEAGLVDDGEAPTLRLAVGVVEAAADDCETVGDALAEMVGVGVADTADDALDAFDAAHVSVGEGVGVGKGLDAFDTAGEGEGVGVDVSVGDGVALEAFDATGEGDGVGVGVGKGEDEGVGVAKGAAASTPAEFTPPQLPAQGTHVGSEVLTTLIERAPIL
jgi:hypothetical protein